jgi:hypothetical protein
MKWIVHAAGIVMENEFKVYVRETEGRLPE